MQLLYDPDPDPRVVNCNCIIFNDDPGPVWSLVNQTVTLSGITHNYSEEFPDNNCAINFHLYGESGFEEIILDSGIAPHYTSRDLTQIQGDLELYYSGFYRF